MTRFRPQDKTQECIHSKKYEPCLPAIKTVFLNNEPVKLCKKHLMQFQSLQFIDNPIIFERANKL